MSLYKRGSVWWIRFTAPSGQLVEHILSGGPPARPSAGLVQQTVQIVATHDLTNHESVHSPPSMKALDRCTM
jgi:hypothetical protein